MTPERADFAAMPGVRRLAGRVSAYTLALAAAGTVRVLAVLLIVRAVSPAVYGTYIALWVVMWGIHAGGDLGLGAAALRFSPECATPGERRSLFGTLIAARAAVGSALTAVVVVLSGPLARWSTGSADNARVLVLLALSRPFAMVCEALSDELRARDEMGKVSALVILNSVLVQGTSVLLVFAGGFGLTGLVVARGLGDGVACAAAAFLCFRFVRGRPTRPDLSRLLAFGWPIGAMYLLGILRGLDRNLVRVLASLDHVATYELAARLVGPIGLFNIALAKVFEPVIYRHSQSHDTPVHVDLFLRGYVVVFGTVAMGLSVFAPEAIGLLAPEAYRGTVRLLPALAFAAVGDGLTHVAGIGADLAKRTRVWAVAAVLTLAVGFSVAAGLVPSVGVAGVGLGWVAASVVTTVFAYAVARKLSGFSLPVGRALTLVVVGAVLGTVAAWHPWPLSARLALLAGYGVAAWRFLGLRWQSVKALSWRTGIRRES